VPEPRVRGVEMHAFVYAGVIRVDPGRSAGEEPGLFRCEGLQGAGGFGGAAQVPVAQRRVSCEGVRVSVNEGFQLHGVQSSGRPPGGT